MFTDVVLAERNSDIEEFGKKLGFSKIIFKEDFTKNGIVMFSDYEVIRKLIKQKKVKIVVNAHVNDFKDSLFFRAGGVNEALCNEARDNDVAFAFTLDNLNDPILIGRVKQNIKLFRKCKVRFYLFSFAKNKYGFRSVYDLQSLLKVFGANGKEAKLALGL